MIYTIICSLKNNAPLLISILAVLFTILSFWWLHWRQGKITVSQPIKFGINFNKGSKKIIIQLPLIFYNNGAATIIVNNLRLKTYSNNNYHYLFFNNTFNDLESNEGKKWGYAFPIEGRKTFSRVFVFMKTNIDFIIPPISIDYSLEAQLNNKDKWKILYSNKLITPEKHHKTMYEILRAYDNY